MFECTNKNRIFKLETNKIEIRGSNLSGRIQYKLLTLLKLAMLQTYLFIFLIGKLENMEIIERFLRVTLLNVLIVKFVICVAGEQTRLRLRYFRF